MAPAVTPTAAPGVAPGEVVSDPMSGADAEPTEVPSEPANEPTIAPPEIPTQPSSEPTATPVLPFTANVKIVLVNSGDIFFGDEIILRAAVENANAEYTIRWEQNDGSGWKVIDGEDGHEYRFIVTQENVALDYRVVLTAAV